MELMQQVKEVIEQGIPSSKVSVSDMTGTQDHLEVLVEADCFAGKPLMQQHRMVMDLLKNHFDQGLHAIKIKTRAG